MKSKEKVGFGIVGCGVVAEAHTKAVSEISGANLKVLCDTDIKRSINLVKKFHVPSYYWDFSLLLRDQNVHAVDICTPHDLDRPMALCAAQKKKNIIMEKPIAINPDKRKRTTEACQRARVKLEAVLQYHSSTTSINLRREFIKGSLGNLFLGSAYLKWCRDEQCYGNSWRNKLTMTGSGVLMTQAIHFIDLLHWLMGSACYI